MKCFIIPLLLISFSAFAQKRDTIPVILWISDGLNSTVIQVNGFQIRNVIHHPRGQEYIRNDAIVINDEEYDSYEHIAYLNNNKKRFSKSVKIFQP